MSINLYKENKNLSRYNQLGNKGQINNNKVYSEKEIKKILLETEIIMTSENYGFIKRKQKIINEN